MTTNARMHRRIAAGTPALAAMAAGLGALGATTAQAATPFGAAKRREPRRRKPGKRERQASFSLRHSGASIAQTSLSCRTPRYG